MIIYVDENMPPSFADGFQHLQESLCVKLGIEEAVEIKSIKKEFGKGIADEAWIPLAGQEEACVITQDFKMNRIKHQIALCKQYNLGMFFFRPPSKKKGFKYWDLVKLIVKHWPSILQIAVKEPRPFAYRITSRAKEPEKMD